MEDSNLNNLINNVLQSPTLRNAIETCIRSATPAPSTSGSSRSVRLEARPVRNELQRLFPSVAPRTANRTNRSSSRQTFARDIILLTKPTATRTLTGERKAAAYERGR